MENTTCSQCLDKECQKKDETSLSRLKKTREIEILGKKIIAKNYICSKDGIHYEEKAEDIKLQVSICPTDYCMAACPFCVARTCDSTKGQDVNNFSWIDHKKLEKTLIELKNENIVRGISITGGEPFSDVGRLNEIVNMIYDIMGTSIEVNINTNGFGIDHLDKIEMLSYVDALHVSRHHYDDEVNWALFGANSKEHGIPSKERLKRAFEKISYKDIFVLNCLLMKGYIDSEEELHKFLDFAIFIGAGKVGLITPMPCNDYVRVRKVEYEDVIKKTDERLLFTRGFFDFEQCHCQDGVYVSEDGSLMEFYGRKTEQGEVPYVRGFVYGSDNHLRTGFSGEIIL